MRKAKSFSIICKAKTVIQARKTFHKRPVMTKVRIQLIPHTSSRPSFLRQDRRPRRKGRNHGVSLTRLASRKRPRMSNVSSTAASSTATTTAFKNARVISVPSIVLLWTLNWQATTHFAKHFLCHQRIETFLFECWCKCAKKVSWKGKWLLGSAVLVS